MAVSAQLENVWPLFRFSGEIDTVPVAVGEDVIDVPIEATSTDWAAWAMPWPHLLVLGLIIAWLVLKRWRKIRQEKATQARIDAALAEAQAAGTAAEESDDGVNDLFPEDESTTGDSAAEDEPTDVQRAPRRARRAPAHAQRAAADD
ncbi:hypothetical protein [Nesterenkonia flava]|uniref:DUF4381 domain-containing protein n=1 Tax=Nesterenkonia flava TaxID=469799 RepID=A0ABU1FWE1_9MICC|nr:hypothetical protein [Nesterenkonia flava]MDR5712994.1 hypothetical protein [Nesterenkonia flava]